MQKIIPEYIILPASELAGSNYFDKWNFLPTYLPETDDYLFSQVIAVKRKDGLEVIIGHQLIMGQDKGEVGCKLIVEPLSDQEILALICSYHHQKILASPIIMACFLRLCLKILPRQECPQFLFQKLQFKINDTVLKKYEKLLLMNERCQLLFHNGILSEKILPYLLSLEQKELETVVGIIEKLKIGGNKQRRLAELLNTLCRQYDTNIDELIREAGLQIESQNLPQLTSNLLNFLYEKAHPASSQAKREFAAQKQGLELPPDCDLLPAKSFERDEVTFTAVFKSMQQFKEKWLELRKILVK